MADLKGWVPTRGMFMKRKSNENIQVSLKALTMSLANVLGLNSVCTMIEAVFRSWWGSLSFVVWVSHSPARTRRACWLTLNTQWAPVKTTRGWINEPPQRHSRSETKSATYRDKKIYFENLNFFSEVQKLLIKLAKKFYQRTNFWQNFKLIRSL